MKKVYAAIDAYTIKPAKSLGLDSKTGSIELGKSAKANLFCLVHGETI